MIGGFPGLFANYRGRIYDVRDKSTCPSYHNLAEKTEAELEQLLLAAMQNQLAELRAQEGYDEALARQLEEKMSAIAEKRNLPVDSNAPEPTQSVPGGDDNAMSEDLEDIDPRADEDV